jgi:phytoene dehydrogenase-like protein
VRSDRDVHPDFIHDTFSAFYPLALGSPAIRNLNLEAHGLRWCRSPAVVGVPKPEGGWSLQYDDPIDTALHLDDPADADAYTDLVEIWRTVRDPLLRGLLTPFPPLRAGLGLAAKLRKAGGLSFVKMLAEPANTLVSKHFRGVDGQLLIAGNAGHADIPLNAAGSGLFGWLMTMLGQEYGFPAPEGGAASLTAAMITRLTALGGEVRCGAEVSAVLVRDGRAYGVRCADGEIITAGRAVLADVAVPRLYSDLLADAGLPERTRDGLRQFDWDPGTVKVDFALSGPVPWADRPERMPGTVHILDSVQDMALWTGHLEAGLVPARPFLLLGQMTATDPTRSPAGTESVWAYTHVPQRIRGDAGDVGGTISGDWDGGDGERFADRMQARIERVAPGFGSRILARRVLTPPDLERRNANLVGGAIGGGTSAVHQQLIFRPMPGLGRAETPVKGLFLASSGAHPGGGVHGACGANAARAALAHDKLRFRTRAGRPG